MEKIVCFLDSFVERVCQILAILFYVLTAAVIIQVFLRYILNTTIVKLDELQWHLYGFLVMASLAYAQLKKAHVSIDVFSHNFSKKTKIIVTLLGTLILFFPFCLITIYHSVEYTTFALISGERSNAPSGLPYRWIIKGSITFGFILWFLANLSLFLVNLMALFPKKKIVKNNDRH